MFPRPEDNCLPKVPGFKVVQKIGFGTYGEVFRAWNTITGEFFAIKLVTRHAEIEIMGLREYSRRFLANPHVVEINHVFQLPDETLVIVQKLADNLFASRTWPADYETHSLRANLDLFGPMNLSRAIETIMSILQGLVWIHSRGARHCDIKPANILFVDGEPKLADFGLISQRGKSTGGSRRYMTPQGKPDDLHAAGVILYELVTARSPGELPAFVEGCIPLAVRNQKDARLTGISRIIKRACSVRPEDRFSSPVEFLEALRCLNRWPRLRWLSHAVRRCLQAALPRTRQDRMREFNLDLFLRALKMKGEEA